MKAAKKRKEKALKSFNRNDLRVMELSLNLEKLPSVEELYATLEQITQNNLFTILNSDINNYDRCRSDAEKKRTG
jgi:hypothetical protein